MSQNSVVWLDREQGHQDHHTHQLDDQREHEHPAFYKEVAEHLATIASRYFTPKGDKDK